MSATVNMRGENGESFIPASQRPDGTWRKARRVKEGYVPQEEVPLYESKGKQWMNKQQKTPENLPPGVTPHKTIPGLFITEEKPKTKKEAKSKKERKVEDVTKKLQETRITETKQPEVKPEATDPAKKLKNLKKRLREIEALEEKVKNGELAKPDPDQLKKINRKPDLLMQIYELEKQV